MAIYSIFIFLFIFSSGHECKVIAGSETNISTWQMNDEDGKVELPDILNTPVEDEGGGGEDSNNSLLSGRVVTEVKMHPNGSAVSLGNKHLDTIVTSLLNQRNDYNTSVGKNGSDRNQLPKISKEFSCIECHDFECSNSYSCDNAAQCYVSRRRDSTGTETYSKGCIEKIEQISFVCTSSFQMQVEALAVECCQGNLCNNYTYPALPYPDPEVENNHVFLKLALFIAGGTLVFILLLIFVIYQIFSRFFFDKKRKCLKSLSQRYPLNPFANMYRDQNKFDPAEDSTLRGMLNESLSSGSGSGLPLFVQRTLAKNIYLEDIIGKGRYGEVWKGTWHEETVAVKIFFTRDEASWARETEIFSTVLLRHENILGFYGSDKTCRASCTQLWLVTHYHPFGSLHDYLQTRVLDHQELFNICLSMINGLLHLHTEIMGTHGRAAIAHRDLNSNNVLVKVDGTCCISDFGLAVLRNSGTEEINISNSDRSGIIRYMSPETLNGTIDIEVFESFRKVDIYAAALVMWEACWRCRSNGIAEEYSRPFGNIFHSAEPTYEEMQRLVCTQGVRPFLPNRWAEDKVLSSMEKILTECWHQNPHVRLTALRIKKTLLKISAEELLDDFKGSGKIA